MICKEAVFLWFNGLSGANRLDLMFGLLNKCVPLELRFLGTCLEDLCKGSYDSQRMTEMFANSPAELGKLQDMSDDEMRSRLIVSLTLLHSSNRTCSNIVFNTLSAQTSTLLSMLAYQDAHVSNEISLLFTLALLHPAFTFEQKRTLEMQMKTQTLESRALDLPQFVNSEAHFRTQPCIQQASNGESVAVYESIGCINEDGTFPHCISCGPANAVLYDLQTVADPANAIRNWSCPPPAPAPVQAPPPSSSSVVSSPAPSSTSSQTSRGSSSSLRSCGLPVSPKAQIKNLELKSAQRKKKGEKKIDYRIQVTWSNGEVSEVVKSHQELCHFHHQLINIDRQQQQMVYFTGPKHSLRSDEQLDGDGTSKMSDYLRQLMVKVPPHILDSDLVIGFFRVAPKVAGEGGLVLGSHDAGVATGVPMSPSSHHPPLSRIHQQASNFSSSSSLSSSSLSLTASPPPIHSSSTAATTTVTAAVSHCITTNDIKQKPKSVTYYNSILANDSAAKPMLASLGHGSTVPRLRSRSSPEPAPSTCSSPRQKTQVANGHPGSTNSNEHCPDPGDRDKAPKVCTRLLSKLTLKEFLSLSEEELRREGLSSAAVSELKNVREQPLNGYCSHSHATENPTNSTRHILLPTSTIQSNCCTVQTVQNQVYMPEASIEMLERVSRNSPDVSVCSSSSAPPITSSKICNGDQEEGYYLERVGGMAMSPSSSKNVDMFKGYRNGGSELNTKGGSQLREQRIRRNSRSGGLVGSPQQSKMRQGPLRPGVDSGNGRKGFVSSPPATRPAQFANWGENNCRDPESGGSSPVAGDVHAHLRSQCNLSATTINGSTISEELGPSSVACVLHGNQVVPGRPLLYTVATSVAYSPTPSHPAQQVPHTLSGLNVDIPRLPLRPPPSLSGMCASCPCSRASATPPPMPPSHPPTMTYPPFMSLQLGGGVFPAFPPGAAAAAQAAFLSTNSFVPNSPAVPPPTFSFLHSPDGMPPEMTFTSLSTMFQGPPPQHQPPQPPGMSAPQQRVQPVPPVPGFVAGPTPNVGFHGNQMQQSPVGPLPPGNPVMAPPPSHIALVATGAALNPNHRPKLTCYNCGLAGHHGSDCAEMPMEEANRGGQYHLSYSRTDKNLDGCE